MEKGMDFLKKKLEAKRGRVLTRYTFYDMKNCAQDFGISTPPNLLAWNSMVGWCAKGVDSMADRLVFSGFEDDNFGLNEIFRANNPDVLPDSAIQSALIASCSFIYIAPDGNGFPRMQVIDGGNATGEMDPITGLLTEGYAVLARDDNGKPTKEAYFLPDRTEYYEAGRQTMQYRHEAGAPLLVPIVHRPDATRPFGRSRISRACISYVGSAMRTIKRSEISAEFYSYPQKYAVGVSQDLDIDRWRATMASMLTLTKDEDGDEPKMGQFSQASMSPHLDQLRMFAALFAGETGLTLEDLGFPGETPSSAESIRAAHESLRLAARKAQRCFGSGFLNAGFLAACLRDRMSYERAQFALTKPTWEPIFEPDAAALGLIGDAVSKINLAVPGFVDEKTVETMTGIKGGSGIG